jgi:hypothetical protein
MILVQNGDLSVRLANPAWPDVWRDISPYLDAAIERTCSDDMRLGDVYDGAMLGHLMCWGLFDGNELFGAVTTEELKFPQRKVFRLLLTGFDPGTEDKWFSLFDALIQVLKHNGFSAIQGGGRKGWFNKLKGYNIIPKYSFEIKLWE